MDVLPSLKDPLCLRLLTSLSCPMETVALKRLSMNSTPLALPRCSDVR